MALFVQADRLRKIQLTISLAVSILTPAFAGIALGASLLPAEWEKKDSPANIAVYSLKKKTGSETITFLERQSPTSAHAPKSTEELKTKTMETVNRQMAVMGIQDWTVTSAQAFPIEHGKVFKLRGSYLGSAKQKVFFEEWKIYLKRGYAQVTFSEEGKDQPSMPEYVESLMKRFQPQGEKL